MRNELRVGGIEVGTVVEVARVENLDGVFSFGRAGAHVEPGLGRLPCGTEEGR